MQDILSHQVRISTNLKRVFQQTLEKWFWFADDLLLGG